MHHQGKPRLDVPGQGGDDHVGPVADQVIQGHSQGIDAVFQLFDHVFLVASFVGSKDDLGGRDVRWYLYDLDRETILQEPGEIVATIRSKPKTPRRCNTEEKTLLEIRQRIEKHIKNSYLKRVDAPVGVKPRLRCWMELNEG